MTQINVMLSTLQTNASSLQSTVGPNSALAILQAFDNSQAAMHQYVNMSLQNGDFVLVHG